MPANATATAAVEDFKTAFPGRVTDPEQASEYGEAVSVPWSQLCWTSPAAFVKLSSSQDVAKALAIVKEKRSRFSIRATGHNPNPGCSSADKSAVVLDLSPLQSKELGADGIARIGAGCCWGDVYAWLEESKRSAIGGREPQVGLAGFLLGGGMSAFPNLFGLGADNIKNFEVVLADGCVIEANDTTNSDLYRALKGGGSNFGVVTRFDLRTHPLIGVQFTINVYNPGDYENIIKATVRVQEAMEKDPKLGFFVNFSMDFVAVGLMYADCPPEPPTAFEPFHELSSLMTAMNPTTNGNLLTLAQVLSGAHQGNQKRSVSSVTTKVSADVYASAHKAYAEVCKTLPPGAKFHFTIQPVGTACVQAGEDNGGNIMGLEKVPQSWWVFTCEWEGDNSDHDAAAQSAVVGMAEKVKELARENGSHLDALCMNFANTAQEVLGTYGAENVRLMKETAAKYDPEGLFQNLQYGGFLLRDNI